MKFTPSNFHQLTPFKWVDQCWYWVLIQEINDPVSQWIPAKWHKERKTWQALYPFAPQQERIFKEFHLSEMNQVKLFDVSNPLVLQPRQ